MLIRIFIAVISASHLLLFIGGCALSAKTEDKTKAQLHLQLGTSYFVQGKYPQALRELLDAQKLNPDDPVIHNNLGLTYLVREKFDNAEAEFKDALRLKPDYTDARNNLGRLYLETGLYPAAIKELEVAAADLTYEQPDKSWANLGQAYFLSGKYEKAKTALLNSLKVRRDSCFTMNYYGRSLFELKEYASAAESLDQAIKLCEKQKLEEPSFYSGLSFFKLGKVELARARFQEVLQLFPKSQYAKRANEMLEIMR